MVRLNEKLLAVINHVCDVLIANEAMLTDLDRRIGDGDHGANIKRGCLAIKEQLPALKDASFVVVLTKSAMALLGKVGGASGPLLAGGLLKVAKTLPSDEQELQKAPAQWFLNATKTFADGIKERGHAVVGDKTFVDYLDPFVAAFTKELAAVPAATLKELIAKAELAGESSLAHTKDFVAKKGRASYLGERSIGTQDPGATTLSLAAKAICEAL